MYSFSRYRDRTDNTHMEIMVKIETPDLVFTVEFPNFHYFRDYIKMNRGVFEMELWNIHYRNKKKYYDIHIIANRKL